MAEDHEGEDGRAHWAKVRRALLEAFAVVGALLLIVVGLWAFDGPTGPTQRQDFRQSMGVLLAALVGLGGLYLVEAYIRRRASAESGPFSEDARIVALAGSDLREADLRMADLSGADLREADLRMADLSRAHLGAADLGGADLRAAILLRADLQMATLIGANLQRVLMSNAALMGADLREANLSMANLSGVNLRGADLSRANLSGAYGWTEAQFRAASSLESATMPDGQNYEDWRKDKESHWDGAEDPGPPGPPR